MDKVLTAPWPLDFSVNVNGNYKLWIQKSEVFPKVTNTKNKTIRQKKLQFY